MESSANKDSTQLSESIAVVSKANGDINYKKNLDKESKEILKTGSDLYNKDYINTGNNGFLKYVYIDDGTQVKIHNNSEVYVIGKLNRKSIMKQLEINEGTVKLKVEKQDVDEFTVITPTSVASVKGTSFWVNCYGNDGDKFYGESGVVSILNKKSGKKVDLKANKVSLKKEIKEIENKNLLLSDKIDEDSKKYWAGIVFFVHWRPGPPNFWSEIA